MEGKDLERFNEIERKLSYEDLILFRGFAQAEIDLELEKNQKYMSYLEKKKKKSQAWFSWGTEDEGEAPAIIHISEDQRNDLYKQIGYTKTKEIQTLSIPETYVKFKVLVNLKQGKVSLKDLKTSRDIVEANIQKLGFDVGLREKSVLVKVGLGAFEIVDKYSTNSCFPKILSRREKDPNSEKDLASLEVEYKPPESKTDLKVLMLLNRVDIVFNIPLVQKILAFFIIPPEVDLGYIETKAMQQLSFIQKQAQTQLKLALESKMIVDAKILIDAPSFIIPENCSEENTSIFVLDLGQLEIKSDIEVEERLNRIKDQNAKEIDFYDNYKLRMSDIQMIIANYLDWKNGDTKGRIQNQLLEKVSFDLNFLQCITPENDALSKMILNGKMTSVLFNISPYKLELMMKILNNVLRLADNPTGVSNYKLLTSSYLEIDGPIHPQKEWKKYWLEIRENLGILLYQNQTTLKNFARINLLNSKIEIVENNVEDKEHSFKLIIPQGSNPNLEFNIACSNLEEKKQWINTIKQVQLSHIQYLKGIGASIEKEDKPVVVIEDDRSTTQPILKAQFILDEFSVLLSHQRKYSTEEEKLCDIRFKSLNIGFELRNFDMGLTMQLETLFISNVFKGVKDQYIINSKTALDNKKLAELSFFRATNKKSPKYSEKGDALLNIKLQDVDIFYDPEILAHVVELIFELVAVFKKLEGRTLYYEVKEKTVVIQEEKIVSKRNAFCITANMDSLALTLVDYGTIFASGSLKKAELEFTVNSQEMNILVSLGDLILLDHDEETLYKEILGLKSKVGSFVQIGYHQKFTPAPSSDPYYNKTLKMKFSSVKVVYLQRLLNKIKAYLGSGPLMNALSEGTKKLAKGTIEVIKNQSKSIEMFEIDIEFVNPIVFVPMNYKSEDRIIGSLGNISVKSVLEKVVKTKENWIENYIIKLDKMNLKTKYGNTTKEYSVLNDTDMKFEFRRSIVNPLEEVQDLSMDATISKVSILLSQHQYQMIFRFLDGNIGDKGGIITEEKPKEDVPPQSSNTKEMINQIISSGDKIKEIKEKAERITSSYKLNFPSLDLKVLRGKGYNKLGIENTLAHLVMTNFNFIYLTKSDSSTESSFTIQKISAIDLRSESQSIFKEFIKTTNIDEKMPNFIEFSYQSFKNSDSMIKILMGNPRIVFVPEVVLEIKDFFTNTRKQVDKKLERVESNKIVLEGDLRFNSNISLGEDIHLSSKRKIYFEKNDLGEMTLDGQGHTMYFHKDQDKKGIIEPLLYIADGMTLYVKNLTVEFYDDLDRLLFSGKDSKIVTPTTKGVIRKQLSDQEMKNEKKEENSVVKKEEKKSRFCLQGTFGSPQVIFPENSVSKQSRLVVAEFSAQLLMNVCEKSTDYSLNITGIKIGVEQEETTRKGAPILEPLKVNADIHQETIGDDSNYLIKLNFGNDIKSRISYRDVNMLNNIYNAFSKKKEETPVTQLTDHKKDPEKRRSSIIKTDEKRKSIVKTEPEKKRKSIIKQEIIEEEEQVFTATDSEGENSDEFKDVEDEEFKEIENNPEDEFKDIEDDEEEEIEVKQTDQEKTQKTVTEIKGSTTYKIRFETKDIAIFLVDDFKGYDIPLLDFKILNLILSTKVLTSKIMEIGAELNFEVYANYYNIRLANWEPILENWGCSLKFSQTQKEGEDPIRDFRLEPLEKRTNFKKIQNPLNINVTKEMIDTIMTTSKLWSEGLKSEIAISEKFFPYTLKNQTGLNIQFWKGIDQNKKIKVENGKEIGFDFDEIKGQNPTTELTLEIEDMAPKVIDLKKITKKSISDAKSKTVFIIELEFISGKKIITVRTGLAIENNTTINWDVGISDGNNLTVLGEVKPNDFISIPSKLIGNGYLCVRPSQNKDFDWNHNVPGTKLTELIKLYSGGNRMITCGATDPMQAAQAYYTIVQVKSAKEVPSNNSMDSYLFQRYDFTIHLKTPLLIENLLGWPLEFELVDKTTWTAKKMTILTGTLKRGEKIHVYTANLKNLILMGCKPPGNDWKALTLALINGPKTKNDKPLTTSLSMYDKQSSSVDFLFDYGYSTDQSFREVMIYATHWLINHTGLNLSIKENKALAAGQNQKNHYKNENDQDEDDLLMFTYKSTSTTKKISISIENSEYSNPFSIENVGTTGNLCLKSEKKRYDVGLHISLAPGKFKRTKIITFGSRYSIVNKLSESIILQQFKSEKKSTVEAGKQNLFYWSERDIENPTLCIKLSGDYKFSSPFAIKHLGESFIKIPGEKENMEAIILSVKIMEDRATLFIVISKPEKAPYIINNKTQNDLQICQASVPNKILTIPKESKKDFCWEDNLQPHIVILKVCNQTIQMELDKVQKEKKYTIDDLRSLYISLVSRGPSKILKVSMKEQLESTQIVNNVENIEKQKMNALISLDGIGISLIDATPQELAFIFIENVDIKYSQTTERTYYELKIGDLQMDTQTLDTAFPILFSSSRKQPEKEYIHLSLIHSERDPNYYPYFSFCIQEALIAIDYVFIYEIFKFYELMTTTKDEEVQNITQLQNQIKEPTIETQTTKKMYSFSQFELHPIKATISFKYNKPKGEEVSHDPIMLLLDSLGVTIANIDEATIKLNPLILTDPFESFDSLVEKIQTHYKRAITTEVYKILGSLDVIGNPVGLFNDLSTGVMDFFYEPAKAIFLVQGPEEFTKGFAKGTLSLVTNSVHGTFNTASKVTGSIGHGLSLLTFDKDYIREHQKTASTKPKDIREGLLEGTEAFGKSLFEGFSGFFTKPFEGAQQEGIGGFFKGVGKGLIGVPVKPVTGMLDFATKTTEGISNVKNYFNNDIKSKKRLPRTFGPDGLVTPYSPSSAYGQFLLNTVANQSYSKQRPEYHVHNEKEVILLTNRCILFIKKSNLSLDHIIDLLQIDKMVIEKDSFVATITAKGTSRKLWVDSNNSHSLATFIQRTEQIRSRLKEKVQKVKII